MLPQNCKNGSWVQSKLCQEGPHNAQNYYVFAGYMPAIVGGIGDEKNEMPKNAAYIHDMDSILFEEN